MAWTLFYDTIYAYQDTEDDALIGGVKSTARLFGDRPPLPWLRAFLILTVVLMALAFILALLPLNDMLILVLGLGGGAWFIGWHLAWQMRMLDIDDWKVCMHLFRSNRNAGLIPVLVLAAAVLA